MERLELPWPARTLWKTFRTSMKRFFPEGLRESRYAIGGGTVLAALWDEHRESTDLDVKLNCGDSEGRNYGMVAMTTRRHWWTKEEGYLGRKMDEWMAARGGSPEIRNEEQRVYAFEHGAIDIFEMQTPTIWGSKVCRVGWTPIRRWQEREILYWKLAGRSTDAPVRDPFDIAVSGVKAPKELDAAIKRLGKLERSGPR